ncbi:MAG: class I SAM-dependent DNA methyltransferase [Paracoccaceae bacterium]
MSGEDDAAGLGSVYDLTDAEAARRHYDAWAARYDDDLAKAEYATPARAARMLVEAGADPAGALADFGCGTGLSGEAFAAAGFGVIDGFDISPASLDLARAKGVYRALVECDLGRPLPVEDGAYANAAAVGVLAAALMPVDTLDRMLATLEPGGRLVFSLNDHHRADGLIEGRLMELTDCGAARLLAREHGVHLPTLGIEATLYVLQRP